MSLEARLKQGLPALAQQVVVNAEFDYVRVTASARQRERRNIQMLALVGAAAAVVLAIAGPRIAERVLAIEVKPVPPAERDLDEEKVDRDGRSDRRIYVDDEVGPRRVQPKRFSPDRSESVAVPRIVAPQQPRPAPTGDSQTFTQDKQGAPPIDTGSTEQEAPKLSRRSTGTYTGSSVPAAGGTSTCDGSTPGAACVRFETEAGERSVSISIADEAGGPVWAAVQIDRDADGQTDGEWTYICSRTTSPVAIPSDGQAAVFVEIYRGTCQDGSRSNPVRGVVTALFEG